MCRVNIETGVPCLHERRGLQFQRNAEDVQAEEGNCRRSEILGNSSHQIRGCCGDQGWKERGNPQSNRSTQAELFQLDIDRAAGFTSVRPADMCF